jgi:S1-C subfamily serine protease
MAKTNSQTASALTAISKDIADVVQRVSPSIVAVDARPRVRTSGIIWRPGVIVSTNHTIRRDEEITVTLHDKQQVKATLVGRDAGTDLAVLRVDEGEVTSHAQFADLSALKAGNLVLAVGRTDPDRGVTASLGIVGILGSNWRTWRGGELEHFIRPEVSIFIGFSGGALVNPEGQVIGINTTGLSRGGALTIPASTGNRIVDQLLQHGRVARPYLGVGMQSVTLPDKLRNQLSLPTSSCLMMVSVEPDAPADKAGITIGDILLSLDEAPATETDNVQTILGSRIVGDKVKATLLRGGKLIDLEITLGERQQ